MNRSIDRPWRWLLLALAGLLTLATMAQNVGINATGTAPDPSAMLDISSTTSGLLIPRMTTAQRTAIGTPAASLLVYDLTTSSYWYHDGTQWVELLTGADNDWVKTPTTIYNATDSIAIGRAVPTTDLNVAPGKNVLFGDSLTGTGFKLIYYANKGAFRCGYLTPPFGGYGYNRFWDYDSVGFYSFAAGQNSRAKGFGAFAFGSFGWADGSNSVAFFGNAKGNNSYTFGGNSKGRGSFTVEGTADDEGGIAMYGYTGGRYGVAIGGGTTGLGASSSRVDYAVAIGWNSDARGQASVAIGPSDAFGYNSFATGWVTEARGNYTYTMGYRTIAYPYGSLALGRYNVVTGDSAAWVSTDPVLQIGDGTSNTNRSNSFTILKNGQTAVGLNYPTGMLHVSSALGSLGNTVNTADASILIGNTTAGMAFDANQIETIGDELHLNFGSPEDIRMVEGGGSVGIGAAPTTKLDVTATGWQFRLNNPGAGGGDWYVGASQTAWAAGGGKFLISPNNGSGNSAFTITGVSQVGIGTNTPSDRLQVDADAGEDALRVRVAGTTRLRVHDNGGVSVGANVNPPAAGLYVTGISRFDDDAIPDNDNAYTLGLPTNRWQIVWATNGTIQTSDERLKKDVRALGDGLDLVARLRPVRYRWKDDPDAGDKLGLIAQEVLEVVPEVVTGEAGSDRYLGMNYAELVPVLIKAVQEQQEQLEDLRSRIRELEGR